LPLLVPPVHKLFLLLYRIFIISGSLFYYHLCHIWLSFILAYIKMFRPCGCIEGKRDKAMPSPMLRDINAKERSL